MILLRRWEEVPATMSEQEEQDFWKTHALSEELLAQADPFTAEELALFEQVRARREGRKATG